MSIGKFRKVYSVLPDDEKKKPILVVNDKIITWNDAFSEISSKTELGGQIQKKLEELDII